METNRIRRRKRGSGSREPAREQEHREEVNKEVTGPEAGEVAKLTRELAAEKRRRRRIERSVEIQGATLDELRAEIQQLRGEVLAREEALHEAVYDLRDRLAQDGSDEQQAYRSSIRRVRSLVRDTIPRESQVLVVSKGDEELLALHGRASGHFPQGLDGRYSGYYPGSSLAAIGHVEALRARGASHLVVPPVSRWWLDHYYGFDRHLRQRYRVVAESRESGLVVDLRRADGTKLTGWERLRGTIADWARLVGRDPAILDWGSGLDLTNAMPELAIFEPIADGNRLPYLDGTVDVVIVGGDAHSRRIAEAKRVAACGVLRVADGGLDGPTIKTVFLAPDLAPASSKSVSVIVPALREEAELTWTIGSLVDTFPSGLEAEVVLVGSAAAEGAAICRRRLGADRVRAVERPSTSGFVKLLDAGASAAEGEIVVLVEAGVALLPDWHSPLLRDFGDLANAGVVGGKILLFDGRLAYGGGEICDGVPVNLGRGARRPDAPAYATTRPVDFASPAFVAADRLLLRHALRSCPADFTPLEVMIALRSRVGASSLIYFEPESVAVLLRPPPHSWGDVRVGFGLQERRKTATGKDS